MCFGDRLKSIRNEKGLTLESLAVLIDSSETVIRNYEKSRRLPNIEMLLRLCNTLQVTPNYLLQDELFLEIDNQLTEKITLLTPEQRIFLDDFLTTMLNHNNQHFKTGTK